MITALEVCSCILAVVLTFLVIEHVLEDWL